MTGEENTVRGRAPEFSQMLVFSDAAENSAAVVAYLNGETYTRETDMAVPQNFLLLKTNGTAQIVLPWFSSLGMEWSMEATEGLHVTESWHVNPLPPTGRTGEIMSARKRRMNRVSISSMRATSGTVRMHRSQSTLPSCWFRIRPGSQG